MRWIKRFLWLCIVSVLLISNVLTATTVILSNALSAIMGTVMGRKVLPPPSLPNLSKQLELEKAENRRLKERMATAKTSVTRVGSNAARRTKKLAMYNITESALGALPIGGITILIAGTIWELSQLCEGMRDVEGLYTDLEVEEELDPEVMDYVCHPKLPGFDKDPSN